MRIVFLGTPEFALPIVEACARAGDLRMVIAQPDRPGGRSGKPQPPPVARWASEHGVRLEQPEKVKQGRLAALLESEKPDVAVVAAYGRILPPDALAAPRHGCLNVHASLLPELRGAAPAQWAIARGYEVTGVTIMQMDEGLDTGDVRLQRSLRIAADETGESLLGKLGTLGASVLAEALALLERGELLRKPQDHSQATLAPILRREGGEAGFARTALELDRRRRGFTPWPGLWTKVQGAVLKIHSSEPLPAGGRAPGEIVGTSEAGIDVSCGDGTVLRLREVQAEGKKRMPASAWLSGHPLKPGEWRRGGGGGGGGGGCGWRRPS